MEIRCDRAALQTGLSVVSGFVPMRTTQDILLHVKMTAGGERGDDVVVLSATDMEMSISYAITGVEVVSAGEALFPHDRLLSAVSKGFDETVELKARQGRGELLLSDADYEIAGADPEHFPEFPKVKPDWEIPVAVATFKEMVEKVIYAAAREQTRYAFNAVLLTGGKGLKMVASDGHRLAMIEKAGKDLYGKGKAPQGQNIKETLVPPKLLRLVKDILGAQGADKKFYLGADGKHLVARTEDEAVVITSRLIDGHYPNYEEVIPGECTKKAGLDNGLLLKNLDRAQILTTADHRAVTMVFSDGELTLEASSPELGASHVRMKTDYEGPDFKIKFDPVYISDVLKVLPEGVVTMEFKTADDAGLIKEGDGFTYVVMPMNLK